VHSVPLQPSGGASVDEYECDLNEISYKTINYIAFLRLCNLPTFKLPGPNHWARRQLKSAFSGKKSEVWQFDVKYKFIVTWYVSLSHVIYTSLHRSEDMGDVN